MRDIKFRGWHKDRKEMCDVIDISFKRKKVTLPLETEEGEYYWYETENNLDDVELMQYTGCRDKNGVDIYEGDYLSLIIFEANTEFKGEVVFSKGSFCVAIQIKGHDYKVPFHEMTEEDSLVEILGNIWEYGDLIDS